MDRDADEAIELRELRFQVATLKTEDKHKATKADVAKLETRLVLVILGSVGLNTGITFGLLKALLP